jgi:uncharacterized protein YdhG (YjbR/CyaY superfamily)
MTTIKTETQTIDHYIASFPKEVQNILTQVRNTIREAAPDAEEIISYGIPTFTLKGNLVHFAAYKSHIGFYPTPLDKPIPLDLINQITSFRVKENLERAEAKSKNRR